MKKTHTRGFTLIESLVAISIVLVGVTTVFTVAQLGISSSSSVRSRITAMFLAQEALEAAKNLKDSNLHQISSNGAHINWLEGLKSSNGAEICPDYNGDTYCGFDVLKNTGDSDMFFQCNAGCQIYTEPSVGLFEQAASGVPNGIDTGFVRKISVDEVVPDKQARVRVVISKPGTTFPDFEVVGFIYNWF